MALVQKVAFEDAASCGVMGSRGAADPIHPTQWALKGRPENTGSAQQTPPMRKDQFQAIFQSRHLFLGCECLEKFPSSFKKRDCLKKKKRKK